MPQIQSPILTQMKKFNAVSTLKVPFSDSDVINACQLLSYKIYPLQKK